MAGIISGEKLIYDAFVFVSALLVSSLWRTVAKNQVPATPRKRSQRLTTLALGVHKQVVLKALFVLIIIIITFDVMLEQFSYDCRK